jgi:hypothetical protein
MRGTLLKVRDPRQAVTTGARVEGEDEVESRAGQRPPARLDDHWPVPTRYDAAASSPFSAGATRVPITSMARISFACGNDAALI